MLTGTGEKNIATCSGALSGVFGGPELGDTGSWLVDPGLSSMIDPGSGGNGGGSGTVVPSTTPTPTPSCPGVECDTAYVVDPATCECVCPVPYETCGPSCCPGGSDCLDESTGECACPYGSEHCGDHCVESCEAGGYLDYDTCDCIVGCEATPCPEGEIFSAISCECESYCNTNSESPYYCGGSCYDEPYSECGGQCYPIPTPELEFGHVRCRLRGLPGLAFPASGVSANALLATRNAQWAVARTSRTIATTAAIAAMSARSARPVRGAPANCTNRRTAPHRFPELDRHPPHSSDSTMRQRRSTPDTVMGSRTTWMWSMPVAATACRNAAISSSLPTKGGASGSI